MKVLHVALNYLGAHQMGLERMLQSLGEYHQFDWMKEAKRPKMHKRLIDCAKRIQPDIVFFQIQGEGHFDLKTIKAIPGFKINWTGDVRNDLPKWYVELSGAFDITLFSNMRDVHTARSLGIKADYLQIGYDERVYFPVERPKKYDVVFQGTNYGSFPLSSNRLSMCLNFNRKYRSRFGLFGANYPKILNAQNTSGNPLAEARAYHESIIGVNFSHYLIERYTSDRMHRIMGCGCLCLSQNYPGIELEFTPGHHLVTFDTIDEAIRLTDYYLKHPSEAKAIADAGSKHVQENHRWIDRAIDVLRIYGKI